MREREETGIVSCGLMKLFIDQLRDVYSAERQLLEALPQLAKIASSRKLRLALEEHLEATQRHAERLEKVFAAIETSPNGKTCAGMRALLDEGREMLGTELDEAARDAALIAAAQRVEHYEIAAYGTLVAYAQELGDERAASLLRKSLAEEKEADELLTDIAENSVNAQAASLPS